MSDGSAATGRQNNVGDTTSQGASDVWERGLALADGRIPNGIHPESLQGKHYAALIQTIKADVDAAPKMTAAQKARVVTLLRGGDQRAAS